MYSPLLLAAGLNNCPAKIAQKVRDGEKTNDTFRSKFKKMRLNRLGRSIPYFVVNSPAAIMFNCISSMHCYISNPQISLTNNNDHANRGWFVCALNLEKQPDKEITAVKNESIICLYLQNL